ncbi:hypothetical protein [Spirosoma sordidisoli]|uniref:hypothetical protein n=1 Tax=Spirosoma sordidisoli TaxID=2502893 RepID=UPI001F0D5A5F|nr:hypothetical protein [Spirosoma sordidisoli]
MTGFWGLLRRRYAAIVFMLLLLVIDTGAQPPARSRLTGVFLTDSIEIGRPFRYALTFYHRPTVDVLFPDTAAHFSPFQVQDVAIFTTETTGSGPTAVSRDSAVYTLVSFGIDSAQLLQVPVRLINATDCTTLFTQTDTVFLKSKLKASRPASLTLASSTRLAPLRQQFNYPVLGLVLAMTGLAGLLLYALFRQPIERQYRLYRLNRRHLRFLRDYNRLSRNIMPITAADSANQAIVLWKTYLTTLEQRPYESMTTSEIAEQIANERVTEALREADRMIYGGAFSSQSQPALQVLSDIATQAYYRRRITLQYHNLVTQPLT